MSTSELVLVGASIVSLFMMLLWQVQRNKGEADVVDFGWTVSLGFLAVFYSLQGSGDLLARTFAGIFGAIWAFRLGVHIWHRVQSPGEDGRYIALRQSWGEKAQVKFFIFFQAQAILAIVLSVSFLVPSLARRETPEFQVLLALVWFILCLAGESIADAQLTRWRTNKTNHGRTCRAGLWKYSRHPNYFFEWLYWFSYSILAFGSGYWWLTLLSPMLILFSILKVTGIPPTEERALKSRGDDYREYQRTTSPFVPWFPKS